jgi:hypothetical protein
MKYMTFNSSCSYAGLANLLSLRGLETEDRAIALDMGLPYLFAREDGRYLAGPMLQGKRWFDLFLLPRGFIMEERTVRREDAESALTASGPAMLGLRVRPGEKHAVIYEGRRAGCLRFLNNKRRDSEEPDYLDLSPQELAERLDGSVVIGTVAPTAPEPVDRRPLLSASLGTLERLRGDILAFCRREPEPQALREAMDPLFRPLLLDGVTMLELLGEKEVRGMLRTLQRQLLTAVREKTALRLDLALLEEAAEGYQALVSAETKNAEGS